MFTVENIFSKFGNEPWKLLFYIKVQAGNLFKVKLGSSIFKAEIRSGRFSCSSNINV
jgi:hypothetical protein